MPFFFPRLHTLSPSAALSSTIFGPRQRSDLSETSAPVRRFSVLRLHLTCRMLTGTRVSTPPGVTEPKVSPQLTSGILPVYAQTSSPLPLSCSGLPSSIKHRAFTYTGRRRFSLSCRGLPQSAVKYSRLRGFLIELRKILMFSDLSSLSASVSISAVSNSGAKAQSIP